MKGDAGVRASASGGRWLLFSALGTLIALAGLGAIIARPSTASSLATLEVIEQSVDVRPADQTSFSKAESGDSLVEGSVIRTGRTGLANISYEDGSLTRIGPVSTYELTTLATHKGSREIVGRLDAGQTFHRVTKASGSGSRFEVQTSNAVAAVRGTAFAVQCLIPNVCEIGVTEGTVAVRTPDGQEVAVEAGHKVAVDSDGNLGDLELLLQSDPWIERNWDIDNVDPDASAEPAAERSERVDLAVADDPEEADSDEDPAPSGQRGRSSSGAQSSAQSQSPASSPTDGPPTPAAPNNLDFSQEPQSPPASEESAQDSPPAEPEPTSDAPDNGEPANRRSQQSDTPPDETQEPEEATSDDPPPANDPPPPNDPPANDPPPPNNAPADDPPANDPPRECAADEEADGSGGCKPRCSTGSTWDADSSRCQLNCDDHEKEDGAGGCEPRCASGSAWDSANSRCQQHCEEDQQENGSGGCEARCGANSTWDADNSRCQAICGEGQTENGSGGCQTTQCPEGHDLQGNTCEPIECPSGTELEGSTCEPIECPEGEELNGNTCEPVECPEGQELNGTTCEPTECPEGQERVKGNCVPECGEGETRNPGGHCVGCPHGIDRDGNCKPDPKDCKKNCDEAAGSSSSWTAGSSDDWADDAEADDEGEDARWVALSGSSWTSG